MIFLPDGGTDAALAVADRLRAEMDHPVALGGELVRVRASIGVAAASAGCATSDALLSQADQAMYRAKRAGVVSSR